VICPNCSFDNSLGVRLCTKCNTVLPITQSGRPTVSMDGTITPAEPSQVTSVGSQIKPINVIKRKRSQSAKNKLRSSPVSQAVLIILILFFVGVGVTFFQTDTVEKLDVSVESSSPASQSTLSLPETGSSAVSGVSILESVVQVISECKSRDSYGGSGTVFIDSNHVLTSNHVVASDGDCSVDKIFVETIERLDSAPVRTHSAVIVAVDLDADLAILKITPISTSTKKLVAVKASVVSNIGDPITAIGFPTIGGASVTVTRGEVSGFSNFEGIQWIKSSVSISGGNSGGGVFNTAGALVGVPTQVGTAGVDEKTDCRPDRDTNNDGDLDDDDQCVSVGGFINSLSPAKRAVDLAIANGLKP
jgi:S1-C subfamily serine protease